MGFKEIIQQDIKDVFFNVEEFADKHTWNGNKITAIVDDDNLMSKYSSEYECLVRGSHLVLAQKSEFERKPMIDTVVVFDGTAYVLNEMKEEAGMYTLFLERKGT